MSLISDAGRVDAGRLSSEWAHRHMAALERTRRRLHPKRPLGGLVLGSCLQLTKETSVLLMAARDLGAEVVACAGNPLTTQDDIAAFLDSRGVRVYGWYGQNQKEFEKCIEAVLEKGPDIVMDDGAELSVRAHTVSRFRGLPIIGGTEETTTGVSRIRSVASSCGLRFPVITVNNARTKSLFDNRYGTGQSTVDGVLRSCNLLVCGREVVISGYGWVGRGVAGRFRAMGARVTVTEADPIRALEAVYDGYRVDRMRNAARYGQVFVTCTGMAGVIRAEHIRSMRDSAILANAGHFDVEIDVAFLRRHRHRTVRPSLEEFSVGGRRILLISAGRVANLVATEGHPPEVMDLSFANQLACIAYLAERRPPPGVLEVPREVDTRTALDALSSCGILVDGRI